MAAAAHPLGSIVWIDLTVPNANERYPFYQQVIGWVPKSVEMGEYQDYNMLSGEGSKAVAGICHARGENAGLPPVWMPYVLVDEIDSKVGKVETAGGKIVRPLREQPDGTKMAVIQDPAGAVLTLYQPGTESQEMSTIGQPTEGEKPAVGSLVSLDLTVPNADAVRDFYEAVIGWTHSGVEMGDYQDYMMLLPGLQTPAAGVCHARGVNADLPPNWMFYILVENLDSSLQTVEALGGKRISAVRDYGEIRFCAIQDPAGAVISLFQQG